MKKLLRIFIWLLIAAIVFGTFVWLWQKSRPAEVEYEILEVKTESIQNLSIATGRISPRDEVLIKPQISGIVAELRKEAGDYVRQGEVIATVKVIPEMAELNAAESRVRIAEITLSQTESEYKRQKTLFDKGVIAAEEFEAAEAAYQKALEEKENSRDNLDIVRDGMSKRTAQISNTQIRSTVEGMVLDVPIKVGNSVIQANTFNDGTTIATVADMSDLIFIGQIDETEVGRVHTGMPVKVTIGAIEDLKFDAVLEYISPKGIEENGAIVFEIKAAAQIPDSVTVRAGYSANAEIVLARADNVMTVSESAVSFESDTTFLYVLTDSLSRPKVFDRRQVEIGLSNGVLVEIKNGVELGDRVRGNQKF